MTLSFDALGVSAELVAVLNRLGITDPFPIQALTIPDALSGRDVCGKAKTGSGKTLAFGLAVLARLPDRGGQAERGGRAARGRPESGRPSALILVPTRELAAQVEEALTQPATSVGARVTSVYGGVSYGKFDDRIYSELASDHPIDLCRYQVANCYMGRAGLINSGGASGKNDMGEAVVTAVINKRAGGTGLISGRKAFQRPMKEGIELLNAIQDVYLAREVTIA